MIAMGILGKIKRLYFRDKKSLHDIAPLTGLSRNTIRKWVREPLGEEALKYVRQDMPSKLAAYHAEIEQALKADSHRTKQNRRTAKALFVQIQARGYTGGYSQVTAFVRAWRGTQGKAIKAFVPLQFELGEAFQFDWSDEALVIGGIYYKLQAAHLKLCASRAFWLVPIPSHERLSDAGRINYDWQHYIALVQRKPGALRNGVTVCRYAGTTTAAKAGLATPCRWRQSHGAGARLRAHGWIGGGAGGRGVGGGIGRTQRRARSQCAGQAERQAAT